MTELFPKICPLATSLVAPAELSRQPFEAGQPSGIVVHYTADRGLDVVRKSLVESGLCYHFIIARDGHIEQHAWANATVWHAGKAEWAGLSPNRAFLAIALESWGELKVDADNNFSSWNGQAFEDHAAKRPNNVNGTTSWWDAASLDQLEALDKLCLWAVENGVLVDNICGHDECATPKGRKIDPGGVLPVTMAEYRAFLGGEAAKQGAV